MPRIKSLIRALYRRMQRVRARFAGRMVHGLTRAPIPYIGWRTCFRALQGVYAAKRLLQDVATGQSISLLRNFRFRWREIETNFLIKLIVWREWPIDREFSLYEVYERNNVLLGPEAQRMRDLVAHYAYRPLISIVVPVFNARPEWITRLVDSVLSQTYDRWELILVDDASSNPATWDAIEAEEMRDERISAHRLPTNMGVVLATNHAAKLAHGEWLAFMDHDDELFSDALFWIVREFQNHPDTNVFYTDEELRNDAIGHAHGQFKPGFSPELLTAFNYICHLLVVRKSLFDSVGRLRAGTEGAQDYDLILRLMEATDRFHHIPRILYRWNIVPQSMSRRVDSETGHVLAQESIDAITSNVVQGHFDRTGTKAVAQVEEHWVRPCYEPVDSGRVAIIICSKDQPKRLSRCISSIERCTRYPNYEILIVDNASTSRECLTLLADLRSRHKVVRIENGPEGFSFSRLNNLAAESAEGEFLLFLNDDTYVLPRGAPISGEPANAAPPTPEDHDWLSALVGSLMRNGVGAVGAHLLYPSGLNQHAGLVMGALGWGPWHALVAVPPDRKAFLGYIGYPHNACAVTGACLLTRRALFEELGGFNETELAVSFNDVDYCLRVRDAGYRVAYAPQARLVHEEGASRGHRAKPEEAAAMKRRGQGYQDPYWNPAFSRRSPHFALETRRRSRQIGWITQPRVLKLSNSSHCDSMASRALAALAASRDCIVDSLVVRNETPTQIVELQSYIEKTDCDVIVLDGPKAAWAAREADRAGVRSILCLDERVMLPAAPNWSDRVELLTLVERLPMPYQVLFADPFSIGWLACGLPRGNFNLESRVPAEFLTLSDEAKLVLRREARASFDIDESSVVLLAIVGPDEWSSVQFLLSVLDGLTASYRHRARLILGFEGPTSPAYRKKLRELIRHRPNVVAASESDSLYSTADIFLAHAYCRPRPMSAIKALMHRLPVIATSLIEQGDLMHSGASGLMARAFARNEWRRAIERLMNDANLREELGAQGHFWLESRESWEFIVDDWKRLLIEAAELKQRPAISHSAPARSRWPSTSDEFDRNLQAAELAQQQ